MASTGASSSVSTGARATATSEFGFLDKKFYIFKRSYKDDSYPGQKFYDIYAWTQNKKLAKLYKTQRDMSLYNFIKTYLDKNEYKKLISDYSDKELEYREIALIDQETNKKVNYKFAVSRIENINYINTKYMMNINLCTNIWTNPKIFVPKIYNALKTLGYVHIYNSIMKTPNNKKSFLDDSIIDEFGVLYEVLGETLHG